MQPIISDLVERFERGRLSRRELIGAISLLVGGGTALAAESDAAAAISAKGIDHVSVLVSDLERSTEFYRALFGLRVLSEDKPHTARLTTSGSRSRTSARTGSRKLCDSVALWRRRTGSTATTSRIRMESTSSCSK